MINALKTIDDIDKRFTLQFGTVLFLDFIVLWLFLTL